MCEIDFEFSSSMNSHMDEKNGGRWKFGDPDVIYERDEYEESIYSGYTNADISDSEISEAHSVVLQGGMSGM